MFCIKCGAKLPGGAGFCHKCGARVPIEAELQRIKPTENSGVAQNRTAVAPEETPQQFDAQASASPESRVETGEELLRQESEKEAWISSDSHRETQKNTWRAALSWFGEHLHAVISLAVLAVPLLIYLIGICVPFLGIKTTELGMTLRVTVSWFGKISVADSDLTALLDTSAITAIGVVTLLAFLGYIVFAAVSAGRVGRGQCFANMIAHGVLLIVGIVAVAAMSKAKRFLGDADMLEGVKLSTGTIGVLVGACLGLAASVAQWLYYVKSYGETEARTGYLLAFIDKKLARTGARAEGEAAATADGVIGKSGAISVVLERTSQIGRNIAIFFRTHLHRLTGFSVLIFPFIAYLVGICVPFLHLKISMLGITETAKFGWLGSVPSNAEELVPFVPRTAATIVGVLLLLAFIVYIVYAVVTAGGVGRRQCLTNVVAHSVFLALGIAAVAIYGVAAKNLRAEGMLEGVKVTTGSIGILVGACFGLAASIAQWALFAKKNGAAEERPSFVWAQVCAGIRSRHGADADCQQIFLAKGKLVVNAVAKKVSVVVLFVLKFSSLGALAAVIVGLTQPAFLLSGGESNISISIFGKVSGLKEGMSLPVLPALIPAWMCAVFLCGAFALFAILNLGGSNRRFWIANTVFGALFLINGIVLTALTAPQARLAATGLLGEGASIGDFELLGITYRGAGVPLIWAGAILGAVSVGMAILFSLSKTTPSASIVLGRVAPTNAPYRAYTSLLNLALFATCLACTICFFVIAPKNGGGFTGDRNYDAFFGVVCICLAAVSLFGFLLTLTNFGNTTRIALGQEFTLGVLLCLCGLLFLTSPFWLVRILTSSSTGGLMQLPAALRDYTLVAAFSIPVVTIVQQILSRRRSGFAGIMRKGWLKWIIFVPLAAGLAAFAIFIIYSLFGYIGASYSPGSLLGMITMALVSVGTIVLYCLLFFRHAKLKSVICQYCKKERFRILQTGSAKVQKEDCDRLVSFRFYTRSRFGVRAVYDAAFRLRRDERRRWAVAEVVKLDALAFDPADKAALALDPEKPYASERTAKGGAQTVLPGLPNSTFTGGAFALFGIRLVSFIVTCITLGIAYPFMLCWERRWTCAHTRINGRQTYFDGNGLQLIGKYIGWLLLCVITLGIYSFWLGLRLEAWVTLHTHFDDGQRIGDSKFSGGILGLIGIKILTFFITVITIGLGSFWAHCKRERWFTKHRCIDGFRLAFDGTGMQYLLAVLKWMLLTLITLGIYLFWLGVRQTRWRVSHTSMSEESAEAYGTIARDAYRGESESCMVDRATIEE